MSPAGRTAGECVLMVTPQFSEDSYLQKGELRREDRMENRRGEQEQDRREKRMDKRKSK